MSRYFFHVLNNRAIIDAEGEEHPSPEAARHAAVRLAGKILADEGTNYWKDGQWRMSVADETGLIIFTLDFSATTHE